MQILTILILGLLIIFISANGKMNYTKCNIFTEKLGSSANAISFEGTVSISQEGEDAMVEITYIDDKYYMDPSLFGLVTEDGKTPDTTCLDLRIYRYQDGLTNSVLVNDLSVTSAHDDANRSRSYIFLFKRNEFQQRLNESISTSYYTYSGTYALVFKLSQDPWQIQHIYRFFFQIKLNRETKKILDIQFASISDSVQNCYDINDPISNSKGTSTLEFCQDQNCTIILPQAPIIYLNDNIFMLHKTTSQGLEKYTYSNSEIYFQSDGLLKKMTIISSVYDSKIGQAIYNFKAAIVWSKLRIQASTQLVSPKNRLLTLSDPNTAGQLTAYSVEVCINIQGEALCPTCDAICNANNGDAPPICGNCPFTTGAQILFLSLFSFFLMF